MNATKEQVKHTPGQWHFCAYSQITEPIEMGFAILDAIGGEIAVIRRKRTVEPFHEANARLIAAAPELLEAAYEAIRLINVARNEGVFEARSILAAAIAKAEGRA